MSILVHNQKPGILDPLYSPSIKGDFDVKKHISSVFQPILRQPLVPSSPVTIELDGNEISDDEINDIMLDCCTGIVDAQAETNCRELFAQTLQYYDPNTKLLLKDVFTVSSAVAANLPEPDAVNVIYTPDSDIIPVSKGFIAGTTDYNTFFASFSYYCRFEAFGAYFVNDTAFNDFKTWFQSMIANIQSNLSANCLSLINDFMKLDLKGLTESFKIRNDENENNEEYSFARVLISHLMAYFKTTTLAGLMPFDFENLFCPINVVFINVEKFAHSSKSAIANEIDDINKSINILNKVKMISNSKLNKLAPVARQLRKSQSMAVNAAMNRMPVSRASRTKFKSKIMTHKEYLTIIGKILDKMKTNKMTQNVYKFSKSSFAKPNRRNPDDYNAAGKIVSTKYRPDIHLYLDTSGSISEENYEASVKLAIMLAKKLNVNLYFNTFSHVMSQTTLLKCANRSVREIYKEFQKTPKVTGGTDYEQIWHFINGNKKREDELSIIVTDFEWGARSAFIKHPENLYYMPCANMNWSMICDNARYFVRTCEHNDPHIRRHVLA